MLDNGYALARIEILNWGNFHGYQKFDLRPEHDDGLLFAPPSGSAILGVNGSGKSTLIDALMITLLPFEGSVKLGVTNDVESGSAGGRTIRDYVLGKHSSTTGRDGGTLAASMGRKEGCSMVLLVFRHNRAKEKTISIGRIWWYQNYAVSETQLAFLAYDSIQVSHLCPDGKTPRTPKAFRQHCKETLPQLQVFETMQAYFSSLSSSFGKISRDDLKILNRAFYVKSISQIDQFIRENMLLEQDNPHLDRLLENVRNGQEIALAIETCESKIASIGRILKDLRKLEEVAERKLRLDREERLLSVHREWTDLRKTRVELKKLKEEIVHCETSLPQIARAVQEAQRHHASIQSQIVHNDLDARLQRLGLEIEFLSEKIKTQEAELDAAEKAARSLGLKLPKRPDGWISFSAEIDDRVQEGTKKTAGLLQDVDKKREEKFAAELALKQIREELQHLSEFKTLIPKDLYWIKEEALKELKIPSGHLCFVGELIQVPRDHHEYRRAIESVLFPVSRNLLCHPDHLQKFTQWLDGKGLRADLVAKRITPEELESEDGDWEGSAKRLLKDSRSSKSSKGGSREAENRISTRGRLYSPHQEENAGERFVLDMIRSCREGNTPFPDIFGSGCGQSSTIVS